MIWASAEELQRQLESEQVECARLRDTLRTIIKDVERAEDRDVLRAVLTTAKESLKRSEGPR